jgi:dipeptidyl-peptidase-4
MQNWDKRFFSLLVLIVLGFTTYAQPPALSIEDIYVKNAFYPERVWGLKSMPKGSNYTTMVYSKKGQEIVQFSYSTGDTIGTLFSTDFLETPFQFEEYTFSADETKILFTSDVEPIYRHSTREHVWVYDLNSKKLTQISINGKQRYSTFSPDGSKIGYVRQNNLYIFDLKSGKETTVTSDGEFNKIINGATDWVYEEEFGFDKAFFWSPDSKKIAYYKFNESQVKEFNMIMYQNQLYPSDYRYKYPKAGEENSKVEIYMYDLKKKASEKANFELSEYVPRISWADESNLAVQTLNRLQNNLTIHFVNTQTNQSKIVYNEKSPTYVETVEDWFFLPESNEMLITSEKDGFKHIYSINHANGMETQLTKGNWDITRFYGGIQPKSMIYFQSAEDSPTERSVYSMDLRSNKTNKLSTQKGWNDASFSSSFLFYINTWSDANTPYVITLNQQDGKLVKTLVDNTELKDRMAGYSLGKKEFFQFTTNQDVSLNAWMITPPDFDSTKKYPVLVTIYGGPGSQTVKNEWDYSLMWHHMLAQNGIIVVSVDNRGTGARGADFKKVTYQQLGKYEVEDYIETAIYLRNQSYVDSARIGIWGWSYGGYMSTLALSKGADYYSTAIAVAPVTNWRYYDNIYTERYMGLPQDNADGYDSNSPINFVNKIKGNYLLVHGTADDNVHFQNTAELVSALVKSDVQYDFYMYTDKNHSIYGGNTRKHLFTKFTNFLLEKL